MELVKNESNNNVSPNAKKRIFRQNLTAALFLTPAVLFILAFMVYPILFSGYLSFFEWNGVSEKVFIGFDNFTRILGDEYFWGSLLNNVKIVFAAFIFQVFLALVVAYCLVRIIKFTMRIYMFFYLVPIVISEICIGLLWGFIYNPYFGLLNGLLRAVGLDSLTQGWLGDPSLAFLAVVNAMNFTYMGLYILLFVAAIQNIPQNVYDAATIDGAGYFRCFVSVVIPMIWDTIQSTALLGVISCFKTFSLVFVLTNGGPNHASDVLSTYLYKTGFNSFQMGYASTIGFVQMLLTALAGIILVRLMSKSKAANAYA